MGFEAKGAAVSRGGRAADRRAIRPSFPPTVPLAVSWWAAAAVAFESSSILAGTFRCGAVFAALVCSAGALAAFAFARDRACVKTALLVVVGCSLGVAGGLLRATTFDEQREAVLSMPSGTYMLSMAADARSGDFGPTCFADLRLPSGATAKVSLRYPSDCGMLRYGCSFEANVRFSEFSETSAAYYRRQGAVAVATASDLARVEMGGIRGSLVALRERAIALFDGYEGCGAAFLRAILLGDRSALDDDGFYRDVKAIGLAHVVAVSGAHLSIVSALIGLALKAMRVPRAAAVPLQVLFVVGYLVCTAMPVSGVRAAFMTAVALGSFYARRRASGIGALALCVCCVLCISAEASVSISFALSVLATAGIVVFGGLARTWCLAATGGRFSVLCESMALTSSSGIFTMPLAASTFAQLPVMAPLANLCAMPFFALFCGGGLAVVALCEAAPEAFGWMLDALVLAAQGFCEGLGLLADAPLASVPCDVSLACALAISAGAASVVWAKWPQPSRRSAAVGASAAVLALVLAAFPALTYRETEIIMLDVGQGDAIVVRSGGATVLVDTGNQDAKLLEALARNKVYSLDAVVISHPDDDHCSSLAALDGTVGVGAVYVAEDLLDCTCASCSKLRAAAAALVGGDRVSGLAVGDALHVGSIDLTVAWPDAFADDGGNSDSLCLLMTCGFNDDGTGWTGLLCGDAEDEQLDAMIAAGRLGKVDLYKVGHHGSKEALDEQTASVLSPAISLVSVGEGNRYGHPAPQVLSALEGVESSVYRTDQVGDVVCRMTPNALEVATLR
ncbi:ComEC/Rec2 family competence protein [Raoultibacter massiliensis]|uniref:ComEC/Rec2 family competence protein n=1 Tax=Raoultibacter massiliensis TaxID=1852371 RepID=UPI000C83AE6E|nr:ComEC/Rec2 family competence protein [Raoultibacter massiliensis]